MPKVLLCIKLDCPGGRRGPGGLKNSQSLTTKQQKGVFFFKVKNREECSLTLFPSEKIIEPNMDPYSIISKLHINGFLLEFDSSLQSVETK
jgi:hypothetical protein